MNRHFWIIRHGQTDWNLAARYQGHADIPLNSTGRRQAEDAAAALETIPLTAVYTSDLQRARETGEIIARRLRLPLQTDKRLREINQGHCEGLVRAEILEAFPGLMEQIAENPLSGRMPGGECVLDVSKRVHDALAEILVKETLPLIVSHGLVLGIIRCVTQNQPIECAWAYVPGNATSEQVVWHESIGRRRDRLAGPP